MKIHIIAAGHIKAKYLTEAMAEYLKRLRPFATIIIREISEEKMPDNPSAAEKRKILLTEGERLWRQVDEHSYIFLLDVSGKSISSEELAADLADLGLQGKSNITFIIGGAFGISEELRQKADRRLSFSRLTFTHQMVRLLLLEQIYRSFKINRGEKYHW